MKERLSTRVNYFNKFHKDLHILQTGQHWFILCYKEKQIYECSSEGIMDAAHAADTMIYYINKENEEDKK